MKLKTLPLFYYLSLNCDAFSLSRHTSSSSSYCPSKSTSLTCFSPKYVQQYISARGVSRLNQSKEDEDDSLSLSNEIRELILTLSLESDDETRRTKLSSLLGERLQNQDNVEYAAKFAHLWDLNIIQIGGEIQNEARIEAEQKQSSDSSSSLEDGEKEKANGESIAVDARSEKEKQLWSMVDMMVQSKSVIKKLMEEENSQ